jgi:hypothetical protein
MAEAEPLLDEGLNSVIIAQLLAVRQGPPGKPVNLEESKIEGLCKRASKGYFLQQPPLLELDGPINIVGAYDFFTSWAKKKNKKLENRSR